MPLWSLRVLLIHCFDIGFPQVALGPFGASRVSLGNLLIHCFGPRAPQLLLWPLEMFIAIASDPRVPQASLWPSAAALIYCFGPGAPQGSFGPLGGLEQFSRISVIHRGAPRGSQVPLGISGVCPQQRHRVRRFLPTTIR